MAIWTDGLRPCFPVLGDDSIAEHNGEPLLGLGWLRNTVVWAMAVARLQGVCTDCMMVASGWTSAESIFTQVQDV